MDTSELAVGVKGKEPKRRYRTCARAMRATGTAEEQARSRRDLLVDSLLAMLGIVLLLSIVMGNYGNLLLVLLNLPFALVGGIFAGWLTGGNLSLGSLVGFVTLFGITVRNSIMLFLVTSILCKSKE